MRPLPKMRSAVLGFTLIEIVMVLVLLGILSAVAVPKYFDLQEEAQAKACQHNRGVVLSAIHTQMAAAKIADDSQLFNDSSVDKATESAQKVLQEDFIDKQQTLCPSDGHFSAKAVEMSDGNYEYHVYCDIHAKDSDSSSGGNGSTVVTREEANAFLQWLQAKFLLSADQKWVNDYCKRQKYDCSDLSHFFSTTGTSTEIDSGAAINPQSMTTTVTNALKNSGLDTDNVIWRLEKAPGGWNSCKGTSCTGTMLVTIANKSDTVGKNDGDPISVSQYKLTFTYGADGAITTKDSSKTSTTTAKLEKKVNAALDKNTCYWALKTK